MKRTIAALGGICLGALLYAGIKLFVQRQNAAPVAVIGGADGPTAIFVTSRFDSGVFIAMIVAVIIAAAVSFLVHKRRKQK